MLSFTGLSKSLQGYASKITIYVINKISTKLVDTTPYDIWYNKKPILFHIKLWDCPRYVKRTISDKLETKFDKCIFMGYLKESSEYYFHIPLK